MSWHMRRDGCVRSVHISVFIPTNLSGVRSNKHTGPAWDSLKQTAHSCLGSITSHHSSRPVSSTARHVTRWHLNLLQSSWSFNEPLASECQTPWNVGGRGAFSEFHQLPLFLFFTLLVEPWTFRTLWQLWEEAESGPAGAAGRDKSTMGRPGQQPRKWKLLERKRFTLRYDLRCEH